MDKLPVELQPDERVIMRVRRTPVFFIARLVGIMLAGIVPIAALLWLVWATIGLGGTARLVTLAVCALWALFWLWRGYFSWYRYVHDQWIITDQRLIDTYKRNWFNQEVSSADLVNVQDLAVSKKGLLQAAFNFGDVACETAGGRDSRFVLSDVPHPTEVMRVIDGTRDAARSEPFDSIRQRVTPSDAPPGFVPAPPQPEQPRPEQPRDYPGPPS